MGEIEVPKKKFQFIKLASTLTILVTLSGCMSPPSAEERVCKGFKDALDAGFEGMTVNLKYGAEILVADLRELYSIAEGELAVELNAMADSYANEWEDGYYVGDFDGSKIAAICQPYIG
jgi:hypothetical protein